MRISRLVATLWMASAAIFGVGVFLMAQSAIGPQDVAEARNAESDVILKYRDVIRETTAPKHLTKGPALVKDASAEAKAAELSPDLNAVPLPTKKKGDADNWVRVAGTEAILRADPSDSAAMIVAFPVGRKLDLVSEGNGWTKVEEPKTATVGWIKADQLAKPGEIRMARLNRDGSPALDESESDYSDEWAMDVERTEVSDMRNDRQRSGPLGGILRRTFGRL